jgi:two-component SAPR family response regulator
MKILFVDNKSIQNSIRTGLMEQMSGHDVHLIDNIEDAVEFFSNEKPEIVVVEFTVDFGFEFLHYVLKVNPSQHIISLSDALDCAEHFGCDFCLENYRKKRILKHQGIHDLLYLIDNFSQMPCEFAHKLNHIFSEKEKDASKNDR